MELRESQEKFSSIVSAAQDAIIMIDPQGLHFLCGIPPPNASSGIRPRKPWDSIYTDFSLLPDFMEPRKEFR